MKRKSFKARHAKNIAKGKMSAAYWANKVKWQEIKMALTKEQVEKRLQEIPVLLQQLSAEKQQLLGYQEALKDCEEGNCACKPDKQEKKK